MSAWVSDVALLDNRGGDFDGLDPTLGRRNVRLAELLGRLMRSGTHIVLATRDVPENRRFIGTLRQEQLRFAAGERLTVHQAPDLHEKGFLTDSGYVKGSMNFTYNGVEVHEEAITYTTDPEETGKARLHYRERWGGVLKR